jgi:formate dehydrogenase subunit gamma
MADTNGDLILRFRVWERMTHWAIAIAFIFLFLSGLAMFHPFFFWTSLLFGGGQFMRFIHPIAGVALAILFYSYAAQEWHDNRWLPVDSEWVRAMWSYMRKEHPALDSDKYNGGEKLMFWSMVPTIAVLFLTGIVLWQPWFAPAFSPGFRRVAGLVHAAAAFIMFVGIGIHWYAAYWTRGSVRAMVRGTVSRSWARFHHPAWYRDVTGKEEP